MTGEPARPRNSAAISTTHESPIMDAFSKKLKILVEKVLLRACDSFLGLRDHGFRLPERLSPAVASVPRLRRLIAIGLSPAHTSAAPPMATPCRTAFPASSVGSDELCLSSHASALHGVSFPSCRCMVPWRGSLLRLPSPACDYWEIYWLSRRKKLGFPVSDPLPDQAAL